MAVKAEDKDKDADWEVVDSTAKGSKRNKDVASIGGDKEAASSSVRSACCADNQEPTRARRSPEPGHVAKMVARFEDKKPLLSAEWLARLNSTEEN